MHAPAIRNNPFVVFLMFVVIGFVFARAIDMSERNTVFTLALFSLAGLIAVISDVQDRRVTSWTRKLDTVVSMERAAAPVVQNEIALRNIKASVWYGHATQLANSFHHFRDFDGSRVVAYLGNDPIGVFMDDDNNWIILGNGEVI